jgi:hypothetical protein
LYNESVLVKCGKIDKKIFGYNPSGEFVPTSKGLKLLRKYKICNFVVGKEKDFIKIRLDLNEPYEIIIEEDRDILGPCVSISAHYTLESLITSLANDIIVLK